MSQPSPASRIRFGPFQLDRQSGELWRAEAGDAVPIRLSPQPAELLAYLIDRRPQVVTRQEIKQLLWPDIEVELEQSLHTCIRKIRAALGDSASDPRYVETIPRRGYRFVGPVDASGDPEGEAARPRRPMAWVVGLGLAAVLAVAALRFGSGPPAPSLRIAVMPFEPLGEIGPLAADNDIAESIVHLLANRHLRTAEVIGPTTTERFDGRPPRIRELVEELAVDYVVNARQGLGPTGERVLVEVIRARDGAHIWVRYLDELPEGPEVAEIIAEATATEAR